MKRVTVNVGGRAVEAELMAFTLIEDQWSVCRLEDGTIFKIKTGIATVFKLPTKDPITGAPQLLVQGMPIVSVEPPETPLPEGEVQ